jgi:hypothetical protein
MNFKARFAPEVRIRLTDDLGGIVCTVRRRWFHTKSDEFAGTPPGATFEPIDDYVASEPSQYRARRRNLCPEL